MSANIQHCDIVFQIILTQITIGTHTSAMKYGVVEKKCQITCKYVKKDVYQQSQDRDATVYAAC